MENISTFQFSIFLIIILALILQYCLSKAKIFKKVNYSPKKRLGVAFSISAPMILASHFMSSFPMFIVGITFGVLCYFRTSWHVLKR